MNQFLSNKIIAGIVALALLVGVGVLISSGDTSSTTRNAALVVATPCTKPGQVTKVSKQSVVCATTNSGSLWYATMKAKGKAQACTKPGAIRKKSKIVWVCGVVKKKKLWQATRPLPPAVVASITVIEPGASQPTPALDSTQVATPETPVVADNTVLADIKIPEDKIVTQVIEDATTPPTCATGGTCKLRDFGPGGGIVFYVATTPFTCGEDLKATCTYLEAAIADGIGSSTWTPTTQAQWGCHGTSVSGTSLEIGTGRRNTKIITSRNCLGTDNSVSAASIAAAYNGGNTTDWYLPSRKELDALCNEFFKGGSGTSSSYDSCRGTGKSGVVTSATNVTPSWSFASGSYGSSSEYNEYNAWIQYFDTGFQGSGSKRSATYYVRPVRAFSATMPATVAPKLCTGRGDCNLRDIGPGGGIVFYVSPTTFACEEDLDTVCRYLEVAMTNGIGSSTWTPTTTAQWDCSSASVFGTSLEIGTGRRNTKIITSRNCLGTDNSVSAASIAAAYNGGNTTDWYLPSRKELDALCNEFFKGGQEKWSVDTCMGSGNADAVTVKSGDIQWSFATGRYWSSSEAGSTTAWVQHFGDGDQNGFVKRLTDVYVRPVRAF